MSDGMTTTYLRLVLEEVTEDDYGRGEWPLVVAVAVADSLIETGDPDKIAAGIQWEAQSISRTFSNLLAMNPSPLMNAIADIVQARIAAGVPA